MHIYFMSTFVHIEFFPKEKVYLVTSGFENSVEFQQV